MIIKSFELSKFKKTNFNIFLFYGKNEGLKKELINKNQDYITKKNNL